MKIVETLRAITSGVVLFAAVLGTWQAQAAEISITVEGHGMALGAGSYETGSTPTLMAAPEVGWRFDHWEGDVPTGKEHEALLIYQVTTNVTLKAVFVVSEDPKEGWFKGGTVVAWGTNYYGPTDVPTGLTNVVAIAGGGSHNLAVKTDGTVVGWGDNASGQTTIPSGLANVVAIAAGWAHCLALKDDGTVVAWGNYNFGQTNVPSGLNNVVAITAGGWYSLALKADGTVVAWGNNVYGQATVPTGLNKVVAFAGGENHSLVLKTDGTVVGWGGNASGQTTIPSGLANVVAIAAGAGHSLALKADGTVVAWGQNNYGQTNVPSGLNNVVAIAAGGFYSLALKADGTVVAWGNNVYGQAIVPSGLTNVVAIAAGGGPSLALVSPNFGLITQSPSNIIYETDESLRLAPKFLGARSYQWYQDGQLVAGATNSIFSIPAVSSSDAGTYQLLAIGGTNALLSPPTKIVVESKGVPWTYIGSERVYPAAIRGDQAVVAFLTSFPGGSIYYTTNESTPDYDGILYNGPITITKTTVFRIIAYDVTLSKWAETGTPITVRIVPTYPITLQMVGRGSVTKQPDLGRYLEDSVVKLVAMPEAGWRFVRWQGDVGGAFPEATLVMSGPHTVKAVFEAIPTYPLSVIVAGGGRISGNTNSPYYQDTTVNLTAETNAGWVFMGWKGMLNQTNGTQATVIMDEAKTVEAVFGTTVTTSINGSGQVELNPADGPYPYGSIVHVMPIPGNGYCLGTWGGDASGRPRTAFDLSVSKSNILVTALFKPLSSNTFSVTALAGQGGSVTNNPAASAYASNDVVTLTAVADSGYVFTGWTENASGTNNPLSITVTSNTVVKANFAPAIFDPVHLTVQAIHGQVTRSPDLGVYERGTVVELNARTDDGYAFAGWTGAIVSSHARVSLVLGQDSALVAVFKPLYSLATEIQGLGQIYVTPTQNKYMEGAEVTVTAEGASGYGFVAWAGDAAGVQQQITVVMTNNLRLIGRFAPLGTLTTEVKAGQGQIRRSPDQSQYLPGTAVTLTAEPASGFALAKWGGSVDATNNPLVLTMDKAVTVWAYFRDAVAPVVTINSPVAATTSDERFNLSGSVTDNVAVASLRWELNEKPMGVLSWTNGDFGVTGLRLAGGENRIRVVAVDASGNETAVERLVTWQPDRILMIESPPEQQEGKKITVMLRLMSKGDVGGMTFALGYDTNYLREPLLEWSSVVGASVNQVNYDVPGKVNSTFSLPVVALPAGTQLVAQVTFRARSVPTTIMTELQATVLDVTDSRGEPMVFGTDAISGHARILARRIVGDNNANNRLDIGDATIIQRFVTQLETPRAWDISGNDLNLNGSLDSGDVTKVLRVVVGLDAQPAVLGASSAGGVSSVSSVMSVRSVRSGGIQAAKPGPPPELALLVPNALSGQAGDLVKLQVVLTNLQSTIAGATFVLDYPTNTLRLLNSQSLRIGTFVPGTVMAVWNVAPGQNDYLAQTGRVSLAVSSAMAWPGTNGVLAELTFQVQSGASGQSHWPLRLSGMEITPDGYDNRQLPSTTANFATGTVVVPPRWSGITRGPGIGDFSFELTGAVGMKYGIEASTNLVNWTPLVTLTNLNGTVQFTNSMETNYPQRFFRAKPAN